MSVQRVFAAVAWGKAAQIQGIVFNDAIKPNVDIEVPKMRMQFPAYNNNTGIKRRLPPNAKIFGASIRDAVVGAPRRVTLGLP